MHLYCVDSCVRCLMRCFLTHIKPNLNRLENESPTAQMFEDGLLKVGLFMQCICESLHPLYMVCVLCVSVCICVREIVLYGYFTCAYVLETCVRN